MVVTSALDFIRSLGNNPTAPTVCLAFGEQVPILDALRQSLHQHFAACNRQRLELTNLTNRPSTALPGHGLFSIPEIPNLFELIHYGLPPTNAIDLLSTKIKSLASDSLLIVCYDIDYKQAKSAFFRKVSEMATTVIKANQPTEKQMKAWIVYWQSQNKLTLSANATDLLVKQTQGNLMATKQIIDKLSLSEKITDDEWVRQTLFDGARHDIFTLSDTILQGHATKGIDILNQLRFNGVADSLILWTLTDIINSIIAIKSNLPLPGFKSRLTNVNLMSENCSPKTIKNLLSLTSYADKIIKGLMIDDIDIIFTQLIVNLAALRRGMHLTLPHYHPHTTKPTMAKSC